MANYTMARALLLLAAVAGLVVCLPAGHASPPSTPHGFPRSAALPSTGATHGWAPSTPGSEPPIRFYPHADAVANPLTRRTSEPAPMGIADYGFASNGSAYAYQTNRFVGTVTLGSLQAFGDVTAINFNTSYVSFQLNVNWEIANSTTRFFYLVQDVLLFNTSDRQASIEDAIFNWSKTALPTHSLTGNGSIISTLGLVLYFYEPPSTALLAGNFAHLSTPTTVNVTAIASMRNGAPALLLGYDDGFGQVTFDTVTAPWATGWIDEGFTVNATQYAPSNPGVYLDAEWDFCGLSDGESTKDLGSNLTMSLAFDNGHNLEAVPTAFNFGFDTGESAFNVSEGTASLSNGTMPGGLLDSGAGSVGYAYDADSTGTLALNSTLYHGTLVVGGTGIPYRNGTAVLTMTAGTYDVALWNGSSRIATGRATVSDGQTTVVYLPALEPLGISETGLPNGTRWTVTLAGVPASTSGSNLQFSVRNGSYDYRVAPFAGFHLSAYGGILVVDGATNVTLAWVRSVYQAIWAADGLPIGAAWWVNVSGEQFNGSTSEISVTLPNGTYPFEVGDGVDYVPTPGNGSVLVAGAPEPQSVEFAPELATVDGQVTPANATLTFDGLPIRLTPTGLFSVSLDPGNYSVEATAIGYEPYRATVSLSPGDLWHADIALQPNTTQPKSTAPGPSVSSAAGTPFWVDGAILAVVAIAAVGVGLAFLRRSSPPRGP